MKVRLRAVQDEDLDVFFAHQRDPVASQMAAFTSADPSDRGAFDTHWRRIMAKDTVTIRTIVVNERVAGHVLCYIDDGKPEVSYWVGRDFWGHGVATRALQSFLFEVSVRPIYARAVADNIGSMRVLQKCGFLPYAMDRGFANGRGSTVEEILLCLGWEDDR